jgi:hypothetical protein
VTVNTAVSRFVSRRGRPRKFGEPSRAVTLTLPENVIAALEGIDRDLSRAVVHVMRQDVPRPPRLPAQLSVFGRRAVITITPSRALEELLGIVLVPLTDGRALISFDDSMTLERLELKLRDALDDDRLSKTDREIFQGVADLLKHARRLDNVEARHRQIVVLESGKPARPRRVLRG